MKRLTLILATVALSLATAAQTTIQRRTILEEFSTAQCQYCPLGVEYIKAGLSDRPDVIWIVHHAGFLTDNITVPASSALTYLYVGGSYAPAFMLDRTIPSNPEDPASPVMGVVDSADLVAYIDEINALPCYTTIQLRDVIYDPTERRLTGRAEGCINGQFDPEWTLLSIYIVEDSIRLPQASPNGMINNYIHMHAVHGALTEKNGSTLDFADDGSFSFVFDNILPSSIVPEHSHLVALVHEYSRGNRAANRVLNATTMETTFTGSPLLGIGDTPVHNPRTSSLALHTYPNPADEQVDIVSDSPMHRIILSDMAGRRLIDMKAEGNTWRLAIRQLASGVYTLAVVTDQGIATQKIIKK
ncbi:MAG: T9SS type A sorting domain-containing protein [Bacteroidales bacterium]|nr:T9SS type A sorting domain-containing protein [Bacteroidales bacterium]